MILERLYARRAVRRYAHMTEWRPCYRSFRTGLCPRCFWREITGKNKRARADRVARIRRMLDER